jgi:recombination protein RecA
VLTAVFGLVIDAQQHGEPTAWVSLIESSFFPPDASAGGVDLDSLPVVRAQDSLRATRAALHLLRSGSFGLVVIDLGMNPSESKPHPIPMPLQTKLVGLAQKHDTAVVVLTEKSTEQPSLGSLVSLRAESRRKSAQRHALSYEVQLHILKDKRRGPGGLFREMCYGPDGLC